MSEERKLILKMLQENRISIDEAETLLDAMQVKSSPQKQTPPASENEERPGENILKQMGPGIDQIMGSVSNLIGSVTSQLGPTIEKKFESWRQPSQTHSHEDSLEEQKEEQTLTLDPNCQKLKFHNLLGNISISGGSSSDQIVAKLIKKPERNQNLSQDQIQAIKLKANFENQEMILSLSETDPIRPEQLKVHVALQIPASLHLELSTLNQDIVVEKLSHAQGECQLKTQSGDLKLDQVALKQIELDTLSGTIRADQVSESFKASSRSGDILLKGSVYQAALTSQSGYLRLETAVSHSLKAESQSSDISLQLLEGHGKIDLQTTSGDIELVGHLQAETTLNSASGDLQGDITIAPTAACSLNSNSGDIDLILRPESDCKIDLASRSGDVEWRIELKDSESSAQSLKGQLGAGAGSLMARTNSGDILLS
ncbi:hypothetical protein COW36_14875 [bacterium (Candidatus Blackallbacteria) CG17_big_fil_post_rev_8_21_14_2_50_48_46]|uniref:Uncharacterized protein n=1 Tax=bacterium (Candidatus Blackallbacteria) CG17_big_fil_post_rev_8_21_14_2_50_48_46 TaxID=2014261 RepID=A0A2M7G2G4_9BACT|nr:MAG: hypothetical protein COW64_11675 [bacterium (Candidatus Blackallbacteria) CG18_big_fil_WC_8_21_14_2_50_49_26]PIW15994.1 MAG: hypothetical protein COW36_14875 [bacterium (Candidatus Blackallbacteria) CG17_big_fil_post_rev_8_21_14_2_50_48_46]PIW50406.1 MAG: hypothetical protein COW20_02590 [bacterium (Candidatus Blackallbacteria) CG13_big_fil_rev_8_21_14_2_50_49_14]